MLFYTEQAMVLFLVLIGIWALVTGVFEIIAAVELRKVIEDEIWLLLVGIISVLFGIFLIALAMTVKSYAPKRSR